MRYDIIAGLKGVQQGVEKSLWEAQQASEAVDAADDKLARLMADLEALDTEKDQAAITLKQKEVEASQTQTAELKKVAAEKAAIANAAIKAKAEEVWLLSVDTNHYLHMVQVQKVQAESQTQTEKLIAATKALRAEAAAAMEEVGMCEREREYRMVNVYCPCNKLTNVFLSQSCCCYTVPLSSNARHVQAKIASAEYQSALSSGQTEGLAALEATAKQVYAPHKNS